jgi:Tol biopolymer transport system component
VNTEFDESEGQFSPDSRWLAYVSNKSGASEVYVRAFSDNGDEIRVSTAGGMQVRWRPDGNELFYVTPDDRLMAVSFRSGGSATPEIGLPVALFVTHLATGASVVGGKPQYAVARDGRFLMNVAIEPTTSAPITVVLNWTASLRKR